MLREVPVTASGVIEPAIVKRLRRELGERRTLADVLEWASRYRPPRTIREIVTQDEYMHDIVVELEPRLWLVFDAN